MSKNKKFDVLKLTIQKLNKNLGSDDARDIITALDLAAIEELNSLIQNVNNNFPVTNEDESQARKPKRIRVDNVYETLVTAAMELNTLLHTQNEDSITFTFDILSEDNVKYENLQDNGLKHLKEAWKFMEINIKNINKFVLSQYVVCGLFWCTIKRIYSESDINQKNYENFSLFVKNAFEVSPRMVYNYIRMYYLYTAYPNIIFVSCISFNFICRNCSRMLDILDSDSYFNSVTKYFITDDFEKMRLKFKLGAQGIEKHAITVCKSKLEPVVDKSDSKKNQGKGRSYMDKVMKEFMHMNINESSKANEAVKATIREENDDLDSDSDLKIDM